MPSGSGKQEAGVKNKKPNFMRSLGLGLGILAALVIYAYGFQVTKVNLAETKSERRQTQLVRILRALAKPEIFAYEKTEFTVSLPVMVPCPESGFTPPEPDKSGPYLVMTPACADPRETVIIEGFNFDPFSTGPINFMPADSDVSLQLGTMKVDQNGYFQAEIRLSNRPNDKVQEIRTITRHNIGAPHLTRTAYDTWDKIIETVFLALLATTFGTLLAIPLSFLAARNLMKDISSTLISTSLSILFIPVGIYIGIKAAYWASVISGFLTGNPLYILASFIVLPLLIWLGVRVALPPQEHTRPPLRVRTLRTIILIGVSFAFVLTLYLISYLGLTGGGYLAGHMGSFGFLGSFLRDLSDILNMIIIALVALASAGVFSSLAGRLGIVLGRTPEALIRILQTVLAVAAGALLFFLLMAILNWFYEFRNYVALHTYAAIIGGIAGLVLGLTVHPKASLPTGMVVYYSSRTIFNALRSIEPLVMAIVFVVWVGIGPFAGSMALALHTIAALGKLYSEQVESIQAGPIEAVQATGANRLQTIVYGVVPQIVPPYISFTMYRWDINVRMSTIIGFAGGGGIGFLLQQNINLLNYRAASAQMLAIAIVVASMDYLSSKMREKIV